MKSFLLILLSLPAFGETLVIDCGSPADRYFTGGIPFTISTPGARGDLTLRYGAGVYRIPRPPGFYNVKLVHRETGTINGANQRSFSIKINDHPVMNRFDLFAASGLAPLTKSYRAVSDGFITIAFDYELRSAVLSSIEITDPVLDFVTLNLPATIQAPEGIVPVMAGFGNVVYAPPGVSAYNVDASAIVPQSPCSPEGGLVASFLCVPGADNRWVWKRVAFITW